MNNIHYIRQISHQSAESVISEIGFDRGYIKNALKKYDFKLIKICNLTSVQANIIKQTALSAGSDAAVHREVITCNVKNSDLLLAGSISEIENICLKLKNQQFGLSKISDEILEILFPKKILPLKIRGKNFLWGKKTYIMGILNITPDSFSDGGIYMDTEIAVLKALEMINSGADIIDVGGESTRPFSLEVPPEEQIKRVIPVIEKIRDLNPDIPMSIDTRHSKTAKCALENGADIINDVSGLQWDEKMVTIASEFNVPIIITHSQGSPETMQITPFYSENVIDAVYKELYKITNKALNCGIRQENIIIDPGIGFGKTLEHNIELIKRIGEFKSLSFPILMGISRKSVISKLIDALPDEREEANISLGTYSAVNGADILRVHDVKSHYKAFKVLDSIIRQ
jgi:dihydropteroate synthase